MDEYDKMKFHFNQNDRKITFPSICEESIEEKR